MFSLAKKLSLTVRSVMASAIDNLFTALKGRATYSENIADSKQVVKDIDNYELLDKASILLTPTAYSDARVHSVKTYTGDDYVVGGDFSGFSTDWTTNTATESGGVVTIPDGGYIFQNISFPNDGTVRIRVEGSGTALYRLGTTSPSSTFITKTLPFTAYEDLNSTDVRMQLNNTSGSDITVTSISVIDVSSDFDFDRASSATRINSDGLVQDMQSITDPELVLNGDFEELGNDLVTNGTFDTNSDWTFTEGNGWSISDGSASYDGSGTGYQFIIQAITTNSGSIYKINFDVLSSTGSNLNIVDFGSVRVNQTHLSVGNYTYYAEADAASENLTIYANGTDTFSIDNVSVQQVDPNDRWTLGTSWSIEDGVASYEGGSNSAIIQNISLTSGNVYNIKFTVSNASGNASIFIGNGSGNVNYFGASYADYANGDYDLYFTMPSTQSTLAFYGESTGSNFSIDNISVKDITFSEDVDLARINYDSNGENGHILLEPSRTNSITYSNNFITGWQYFRGTIDANATTSPDGTLNASKYQEDSQTGSHLFRRQSLSLTNGLPYTGSIFLKKGELTSATLQSNSSSRWVASATFDLENGTVTSGTGVIDDYGNGWFRCSISGNAVQTTSDAGLEVYTSVGAGRDGDGLYMYGGMFEQGSYPTSYIPTNGSTVTRDAETCTNAGNSTLINSTEGVLYAEIAALADDLTRRIITITDGTLNNIVKLEYKNVSNQIEAVVYDGDTECLILHTLSDETEFNKIAFKYKQDDFSLFVNGIKVGTDTSGAVFTPNTLNNLSFYQGSSNNLFGKVKAVAVFDEALTDDELELLTGITNYGSFSELAQANGYTII